MANSAIYLGDQQATQAAMAYGVIVEETAARMDAFGLPAGIADYVFSATWTQMYNRETLSFRPGVPYAVDAALRAALTAANAPVTAA
jgi:hypothetical protein